VAIEHLSKDWRGDLPSKRQRLSAAAKPTPLLHPGNFGDLKGRLLKQITRRGV